MKRKLELLPQVPFSILMVLSLRPRHGYEIMQQAEQDSLGKIKLGPGSLYTAIKFLSDAGLIREIELSKDDRRRYYQLTQKGWQRLNAELAYFNNVVELAKQRVANQFKSARNMV